MTRLTLTERNWIGETFDLWLGETGEILTKGDRGELYDDRGYLAGFWTTPEERAETERQVQLEEQRIEDEMFERDMRGIFPPDY